jgi:ribulose-bisphosphate carboxylase large chain
MPVVLGALRAGRPHQLPGLLGDDVALQFGGGAIGHGMGGQGGAQANRIAVEAMEPARNQGRSVAVEGPETQRAASHWSEPLETALKGCVERPWGGIGCDHALADSSDHAPARHAM